MRVAFLVNLMQNIPQSSSKLPYDFYYELDDQRNLSLWYEALSQAGHEVIFVEGNKNIIENLREIKPDICFNTCEGYSGDSREAQIPAILELLGIPYTGTKPLGLSLTLNKPTTKLILKSNNLPTPNFQVFDSCKDILDPSLVFPLFCKPVHEGCGIGTGKESIVYNHEDLEERVKYLINTYNQPVLVEQFIKGRELTIGLIGNISHPNKKITKDPMYHEYGIYVFPILEVDFSEYPPDVGEVFSSKAKIDLPDFFRYRCPAILSEEQAAKFRILAAEAFRVTGCFDVARIDFRLDDNNGQSPYILEVNALPGISDHSDLTTIAKSVGWTHSDLVVNILNTAIRRFGLTNIPSYPTAVKLSELGKSKIDVILEYQNSRLKLVEIVSNIEEDLACTPISPGYWSIKDIFSHFCYWDWWKITAIDQLKSGVFPPGSDDELDDYINSREVDIRRSRSWRQVYSEFCKASNAFIEKLSSVEDGVFQLHAVIDPSGKSISFREFFLDVHYEIHYAEIKNFLISKSASNIGINSNPDNYLVRM